MRGGIKHNSCSGERGRNDCIKREKGERTGEPKCCAEGELQRRNKWEEASDNIIFSNDERNEVE